MPTQDEIAKLAREYAEEQLESLKVYLSEQPEPLKVANDISSQSTASMYVNFLNWLLRTHCIVSKEKVNEPEGEVLSGWVAMDDDGWVGFHKAMPKPHLSEFCDTGDYITIWKSNGEAFPLGRMPIPNLTLENSPMEVEIAIKPKKK